MWNVRGVDAKILLECVKMKIPEPFDMKKDTLIGLTIMTFIAICFLHMIGCITAKEAKIQADIAHDRGVADGLSQCAEKDIRPIDTNLE